MMRCFIPHYSGSIFWCYNYNLFNKRSIELVSVKRHKHLWNKHFGGLCFYIDNFRKYLRGFKRHLQCLPVYRCILVYLTSYSLTMWNNHKRTLWSTLSRLTLWKLYCEPGSYFLWNHPRLSSEEIRLDPELATKERGIIPESLPVI